MNPLEVTVLETFDPKFCCVCTQNGATFYLKIFDNVIIYRQEYFSIAQIINETLGLNIQRNSEQLHEICINCKTKLIDFFIFKRRNEEARKIFQKSTVFDVGAVKNMLLEVVDQMDSSLEESQDEKYEIETQINDEVSEAQDQGNDDNESELDEDDKEEYVTIKEDSDEPEEKIVTLEHNFDENSQEVMVETESEVNQEASSNTFKRKSIRQAHPENWIRNKRKLAKNTGQSYLSSNGTFVKAKKMKCSCLETCRMQCTKKITEDNRLGNFNYFYSLGDIEKQRKFLYEHMKTYEPKRSRTSRICQKLRAVQRCYFLDVNGEHGETKTLQVCKLMFLNTFAISSQMIDTLYRKAITEGRFNDVRGKFTRKR